MQDDPDLFAINRINQELAKLNVVDDNFITRYMATQGDYR